MFLRVTTFFLLLCISFFLAQNAYGKKEQSPLYFDHLTIKDGLSHNTVYDIIQDQYGYIWVATQNGLNKYDGYSFDIFCSNEVEKNTQDFIGKSITALFEDSKGNLWVGTNKQGINIRRNEQDKFEYLGDKPPFEPIKDKQINSFFEDKSGHIWITTLGAGILKYNLATNESTHYSLENNGLSSNTVFDLVQDSKGTIWVATEGSGLNILLDNNQFKFSHELLSNQPNMSGYRKKLYLEGNNLWLGTEGTGLYKIDLNTYEYIHYESGTDLKDLNSNTVRDIYKETNGLIYIATDGGGLNVLNEQTQEITKLTYHASEGTSLNSNALFCFHKDRTGNLWIGSYNGGLNVNKQNKTWFEFYTPKLSRGEELKNSSILSVFQSRDNNIWIGTDGGGLNWLDASSNRILASKINTDPNNPNTLNGMVVKTIFEDQNGWLWIGYFGKGLNAYNPQTGEIKSYSTNNVPNKALSGNNIWTIAEDKKGRLWLGTIGDGLTILDPITETTTILNESTDQTSISGRNIMHIKIDKLNRVWIGTASKGLNLWEEDSNQFVHFKHIQEDDTSISNDEIRTIYQDQQERIWIGTEGGGLNLYLEDGTFEHFTTNNGLLSNNIMGITEDKDGFLWITSFEGISRFDYDAKSFKNFDFHTQENSNQFNQMAILTAADGKIYFGGINGLHTINPSQLNNTQVASAVVFTDLKIYNNSIPVGRLSDGRTILKKPIEQANKIYLSYSDNSFSLDFATLDFNNPIDDVFSYKMEGFDETWQQNMPGQHSATYTNLDAGNYIFKVKHLEQKAQIEIIVSPPFWKSNWFRILLAIFFGFLIYYFIRFIVKRRENEYKQEMLKAESEILKLRNEKLATELDAQNSKLMFTAAQMAHKNEIISNVKNELKATTKEPTKVPQLVRMLNRELESEDYWKEFNLYFNEVDKDFITAINQKYPTLTQNDLRMCTLIRIQLSTKEIASLLNISVRGVEKGRYRLKKRLNLNNEEDLNKFILNFKNDSLTN